LESHEKARLKAQLALSLHLKMSGLAGLYCYFVLLCHDWLEQGGLAVWLIPSEFMDVNYGAALRRYLSECVTLLHVHRFCPSDVQFTDALVSSAVVVFRKCDPSPQHLVRFSFGGAIQEPQSEALIPLGNLCNSGKWTQFPARATVYTTDELTLGDLFTINRGLATGANSFFILDEEETGPRYLAMDVVEPQPAEMPATLPRLYLLDCNEPEDRIKTRWPRFYEYLQKGREEHVHLSYLASHRTPWYSQEQRPPAPFLCTYMGRWANGRPPFRFIWNRSDATAHNVYLLLYPKRRLKEALKSHPELEARVFAALQRITPAQLVSEGRVYGGGLHKVEPKELAKIPARFVLESIGGHLRIEHQRKLFA
jgi:hypothetical protein